MTSNAPPASLRPPTMLDRWADRARLGQCGRLSASMAWLMRWMVIPWARVWFRPRLDGLEHLPEGPCLLVANHNGGGGGEMFCLAALWYGHFLRGERPITGLAHPAAFFFPGVAWALRGLGAIPATYRHALDALASGVPVLVFPGGAHEAIRPLWQARRVDFGEHRGYLRIARQAGVPIVPVGIWGSHHATPILWRSRLLPWLLVAPRLFGFRTWAISVLGLVGLAVLAALSPWLTWWVTLLLAGAWLSSPFPFLPWLPWTVRVRLGPPLHPQDLFDPVADPDLRLATRRVEDSVQRIVDALATAQQGKNIQ